MRETSIVKITLTSAMTFIMACFTAMPAMPGLNPIGMPEAQTAESYDASTERGGQTIIASQHRLATTRKFSAALADTASAKGLGGNSVIKTVAFSGNEWNTNTVFAVNREDPHANFVPYTNENSALENFTLYKENSDLYQSLNGMWRFHWVHCPANRPTTATSNFNSIAFDDSSWDLIRVPLNWQANFKANGDFHYDGYIFNTSGVSWGGTFRHPSTSANITNGTVTQPAAPANYNPVGTYRRTFTMPRAWKNDNRSVSVLFDAVGSNCYVWVNGHAVGYAEDSFTQKEFDITPFINYDGNNVIVVQVFRWCSGSWFETQDMNRLSGISRSVGLVARAKVNPERQGPAARLGRNGGPKEQCSPRGKTVR